MTPPRIHRVTTLELKLEPFDWPFTRERRGEIDAHFADKQRAKPSMWNGQVLLARRPEFDGERFKASYFVTDFASFLAFRDWGFPDKDVFDVFGMGALRSADGAFIMGEMGLHTANAGRVYFPSGTPDLDDVRGDSVDLAGSVAREVGEETGLSPADYRLDPHWDCVVAGALIAVVRVLHSDLSGAALQARIEANLAPQAQPELAAIHLVRNVGDLTAAMPRFVTAFVENYLHERSIS
jgi:8-oxo-dGTP pyrophosphatase MutT (NUDIX family)